MSRLPISPRLALPPLIAAGVLLVTPSPALADNCSSLSDCWNVATGAASAALGAAAITMGMIFLPFLPWHAVFGDPYIGRGPAASVPPETENPRPVVVYPPPPWGSGGVTLEWLFEQGELARGQRNRELYDPEPPYGTEQHEDWDRRRWAERNWQGQGEGRTFEWGPGPDGQGEVVYYEGATEVYRF